VYHGPPGTGKTRKALEENKEYYLLDNSGGPVWFDGYEGEETLVIDDFYGWIKYNFILRLLDGHPCRLPIKGGFTYAGWTTVIITSNVHPDSWYKCDTQAMHRRITSIDYIE
jgi:hypothetical protein